MKKMSVYLFGLFGFFFSESFAFDLPNQKPPLLYLTVVEGNLSLITHNSLIPGPSHFTVAVGLKSNDNCEETEGIVAGCHDPENFFMNMGDGWKYIPVSRILTSWSILKIVRLDESGVARWSLNIHWLQHNGLMGPSIQMVTENSFQLDINPDARISLAWDIPKVMMYTHSGFLYVHTGMTNGIYQDAATQEDVDTLVSQRRLAVAHAANNQCLDSLCADYYFENIGNGWNRISLEKIGNMPFSLVRIHYSQERPDEIAQWWTGQKSISPTQLGAGVIENPGPEEGAWIITE